MSNQNLLPIDKCEKNMIFQINLGQGYLPQVDNEKQL